MNMFKKLSLLCALASPVAIHAEDIEVYVGNNNATGSSKPKVLFILDNSGSMNSSVETPAGYDPDTVYEGEGAGNGFKDGFIFYSVGIPIDDIVLSDIENRSDAKRFNDLLNGCDAAKEAIAKYGYFTGKMLEYSTKGNSGEWVDLKNDNGANMKSAVDCLADFQNEDKDNQYNGSYLQVDAKGNKTYSSQNDNNLLGYPTNVNVGGFSNNEFQGYSGNSLAGTVKDTMEAVFDKASVVTLYSPNYIRWYIQKEQYTTQTKKIEVAKEAIRSTLGATQGVDFGLMIFNINYPNAGDRDGGRIVSGFGTQSEDIVDIVNNIEGETNTPLCETLFEAYNYFAGNAVLYGDQDTDVNSIGYKGNTPPFDLGTTINGAGSVYETPFEQAGDCPANVSIIYITDGAPTKDTSADNAVKALPNMQLSTTEYGSLVVDGSYLPALSHWMRNNDINPTVDGVQNTTMYTVGFGDGAPEAILDKAAEAGGGKYYFASDGITLAEAIQGSLNEILATSTSFTAPSVASNNYDRTQTSDSVYYAMFLPSETARWAGNLKKLKVKNGQVVDANGVPALDAQGNIKSGTEIVTTFWSDAPDGNDVRAGGANYVLTKKGAASRKMLSNFSSGLEELTITNLISDFSTGVAAAAELGVPFDQMEDLLKWAKGYDVDDDDNDGSTTDTRTDIMGDPLHSRPRALTYPNGETKIIVGTNAGFVHLFSDKNDTLTEQWSFIPIELLSNLNPLRQNNTSAKVYGMDGTAAVYFKDTNNDGIVDEGTDKVWVFIGMRRGGYSYYALDISNSDSPRLMWKIDNNTAGFEELGQTWSTPTITYMENYGNEPVLVFGAGYDTTRDYHNSNAHSQGRGVYIVKAEDGSLVGKFTNEASDGVYFPGDYSIPGNVTALDSDYDGMSDRLYASDTGGGVWRMDLPETSSTTWSTFQLADLSSLADTRAFFYGPSVARTYFTQVSTMETTVDGETETEVIRQESPYEAVLVGSGNRSHPLADDEQDYLFMIRDTHVKTQTFTSENTPAPITVADLMDIKSQSFDNHEVGSDDYVTLEQTYSGFKGWKYPLSASEKSLAEPSVLFGVAYFTSFIPSVNNDLENCTLDGGSGALYAFNLHYGSKVYESNKIDLGSKIPPSPTFVVEDKFYCLNCGNESDPTDPEKDTLLELKAIDPKNPSQTTTPSFRTIQNYIYRVEAGS